MTTNSPISEEEKQKKQQEFFQRARKGVLKFLDDKGGKLTLGEMHEYSMNKYLIQHQSFSRLMETLVDENLVFYDGMTQEAMITDQGKAFIA